MNKYKLRMKTLTGLGNEYVYVYAKNNFERYLNTHNLKYARDITKDYQLTDRFEQLQQENQSLKYRIEKKDFIINELEKWLKEKLKEMQLIIDDIDISFEVDYERIDEARNFKVAYNTSLDKLQQLKGDK